MHPRVLNRSVGEAFSFLEMMDTAQEKGRLYGLDNPGMWHHLSTPQDIKSVEEALG